MKYRTAMPTDPPNGSVTLEKVVTFFRGGRRFALTAHAIQEILAGREVTRVPASTAALAGLVNLRGTIIPVVLPDALLALRPSPWSAASPLLILRLTDWVVALQVDAVDGVIDVSANTGVPHPMRDTHPAYATLHRLKDETFLSLLNEHAIRDALGQPHVN